MKQNRRDWLSRILAVVLLAGACGVIGWQGVQYMSEKNIDHAPKRIQMLTTAGTGTTFSETTVASGSTASIKVGTIPYTTISTTSATTVAASFPLELNAATAEELQQLPGIGAALSERILAYRTQTGGFRNREQLLEVDGIGEGKLAQIYPLVYLKDEQDIVTEVAAPVEEQPVVAEPEPTPAEMPAENPETLPPTTEPIMVDLNQATKEELLLLPEMTPELADGILRLRTEIQHFSSAYELLYVDGMTAERFEKIQDFVQITDISAP